MNCQVSSPSPSSAAPFGTLCLASTDYGNRAIQDALARLASVDLRELCGEAKVERCRATRDLRSCGRSVEHVLSSCGHSSLCLECCERANFCPICRIPFSDSGNQLRLRLYNECVQAGLISNVADNSIPEKEEDKHLVADVQRLYSLFDVALENNLASLICHYVMDVCMDESAVSSDPVIAFLLDEVVVKDWCKRTFKLILHEAKNIYSLDATGMKFRIDILQKHFRHLEAISNVIEVLESSFTRSVSARLHDLQDLHENVLKTRQHMEIIMWCIRHQFLDDFMSCYPSMVMWSNVVRERKFASVTRSWPDPVNQPSDSNLQPGSLFIEDALLNVELDHHEENEIEFDLSCLAMNKELLVRSKLEGLLGCYPFLNLRAAADLLFLQGSSELVLAKRAIFVYYLFDRHWGLQDERWTYILDDFAASVGITRHSLVESLVFYLLDDHTDRALKEACALLPEISCPSTHPKIAQVLLEREVPDMALMVLRWCGHDGSHMVSLTEAVTAVRVRVECGLLIEAFIYQRTLCAKLKELGAKGGIPGDPVNKNKVWDEWQESMVSEICYLCVRRRLIDRIIEFPWNLDEEKQIHRCLLDITVNDPSNTAGSLLVVFYLQRYRYTEAYQVDLKLQQLEEDFLSTSKPDEEAVLRINLTSSQRAALVHQSLALLPPAQQQLIKAGVMLPESNDVINKPAGITETLDLTGLQKPQTCLLLTPQLGESSNKLETTDVLLLKPAESGELPCGYSGKNHCEHLSSDLVPGLRERIFPDMQTVSRPFISSAITPRVDSLNSDTVLPMRGSFTRRKHGFIRQEQPPSASEGEQNGYTMSWNSNLLHTRRVSADPVSSPNNGQRASHGLLEVGFACSFNEATVPEVDHKAHKLAFGENQMGVTMRVSDETAAVSGAPRWRSDETSDEDEGQVSNKLPGKTSYFVRGKRRSRHFTRK